MRLLLAAALLAGSIPLLACPMLAGTAAARTLHYPEAKPMVRLEVPDDWVVTPADGGLQLASPDHTSIILAGMAKPGKADVATWQKAATQRMIAFGVAFDPHVKVPKVSRPAVGEGRAAPPVVPADKAKSGETKSGETKAVDAKAGETKTGEVKTGETKTGEDKAGEAKTGEAKPLVGAPSMTALGLVPVWPTDGAGSAAGDGKTAAGGKPRLLASALIFGATLAGKPVDVELLNYGVGGDESFLMQQESGGDDTRAAAIIMSVRTTR